jgi:CDP-diglyceride synthetase
MVGRNIELLDYSGIRTVGFGFVVGVVAMLSELPNSFLKRQLNIAPGAAGSGLKGMFFYLLDQIDLLLGVWLLLSLAVTVTASRIFWSIVFLFVAHQILTIIGYGLGMRATPR